MNQVVVKLWGGESLTVKRSDGFFRCPWCVGRSRQQGEARSASARAMEVSHFFSFNLVGSQDIVPGAPPKLQHAQPTYS